MTERLEKVFVEVLGVTAEEIQNGLLRADNDKWDSITHFDLVIAIEDEFEIELTKEEILQLNSFEKAVETLKAHNIP